MWKRHWWWKLKVSNIVFGFTTFSWIFWQLLRLLIMTHINFLLGMFLIKLNSDKKFNKNIRKVWTPEKTYYAMCYCLIYHNCILLYYKHLSPSTNKTIPNSQCCPFVYISFVSFPLHALSFSHFLCWCCFYTSRKVETFTGV